MTFERGAWPEVERLVDYEQFNYLLEQPALG